MAGAALQLQMSRRSTASQKLSEMPKEQVRADLGVKRASNLLTNIRLQREAQHAELIAKHGEDYQLSAETFRLNIAEQAVVNAWYQSLVPEIMATQKIPDPLGQGEPYYGAMGGGLSYSFTPTSLGTIIVVKESLTGKELNVTDALDWFFFD